MVANTGNNEELVTMRNQERLIKMFGKMRNQGGSAMININKENNGYILVTVLLLLLVLTVVGLAAINTSTIENMLSGNMRLQGRNISKAEAGSEISRQLIERAVRQQDIIGFENIVNDAGLPAELRGVTFDPDNADDVIFAIAGQNVTVDIDMMYSRWIGGSAIEFASGYEGVGKGGGNDFYTFYRVNATGVDVANSRADVGALYRYVP